jgi:hypothetical protein
VHVVDQAAADVSGATVTAAWSVGAGDTCVTDGTGRCTMTSDNLNTKKVASVGFSVTGVTHASLEYDAANGVTTTSVSRP